MKTNDRKTIGSLTAKGGFKNERDIVDKFNNWKKDKTAQHWLNIMGYNLSLIQNVEAIQVPLKIKKENATLYHLDSNIEISEMLKYKKADAQICLIIKTNDIIKVENISIKKSNSDADFNQVDKRYVSSYQKMWHFDNDIATYLKLFTGEIKAKNYPEIVNFNTCKTPEKRIYLNELVPKAQSILISFFQQNKLLIVSDILHGRGALAADWMLVTKVQNENVEWVLVDINFAMNHFGSGDIIISKRGSLHIGGITMQRKGGSPDPTKLQFKIHPCSLFI